MRKLFERINDNLFKLSEEIAIQDSENSEWIDSIPKEVIDSFELPNKKAWILSLTQTNIAAIALITQIKYKTSPKDMVWAYFNIKKNLFYLLQAINAVKSITADQLNMRMSYTKDYSDKLQELAPLMNLPVTSPALSKIVSMYGALKPGYRCGKTELLRSLKKEISALSIPIDEAAISAYIWDVIDNHELGT